MGTSPGSFLPQKPCILHLAQHIFCLDLVNTKKLLAVCPLYGAVLSDICQDTLLIAHRRGVIKYNQKGGSLVFKSGRLQIGLAHSIQHGIYAAAPVLHQVHVFHELHQQQVPGGLAFFQLVNGDTAIEPSRILDLQAVGKHPHLDVAAAHEVAVVPMGYGIDYGLPQGDLRDFYGYNSSSLDLLHREAGAKRRLHLGGQAAEVLLKLARGAHAHGLETGVLVQAEEQDSSARPVGEGGKGAESFINNHCQMPNRVGRGMLPDIRNPARIVYQLIIIMIILVSFTCLPAAGGSSPQEEWNRTFGGTDAGFASSVQQTADGGYIVAGRTGSLENNTSARLIKVDPAGNREWQRAFGGTGLNEAGSVQQTADGGYIVAGCTSSFGADELDVWLIKTDRKGIEEWNRTFGGTDWNFALSVHQTADGGYIAAGRTETGSLGGNGSAMLIKVDPAGNREWQRAFGETGNDVANSVQQTADGGYIVAGDTYGYGAGGSFWLIKTDSSGVEEWQRAFGETWLDEASSVQQTADGGYIVAGDTYGFGAGGSDFWLIKTDSSGVEEWRKTFGGTGDDVANSVQQTADGGYIVAGYTSSFGAGGSNIWMIKLQPEAGALLAAQPPINDSTKENGSLL